MNTFIVATGDFNVRTGPRMVGESEYARGAHDQLSYVDEEKVRAIAVKEAFEMVNDVNEQYTLVGTIVKIRRGCRAAAPNHATRRIPSSTRALLEKRRHMDQQANHLEYAILSICGQRLAEDHANFVKSHLLDAAHNKRCLKMGKHMRQSIFFRSHI
ncbi:hypothetical protein ANCDUO_12706 [Ancylostoma duodenale]|uniref:Uncharacterized protein n=1 Tax=Ancylostoma duodenale TaxID=51022 RepID=A0A0C2G7Y3_9BILA|nr:hypothetical protein ANCDUO_12706 [Ancylostoma duodenale]